MRGRTVPWWVKALVLWHVFCVTVWACPAPNSALATGKAHPSIFAVGDWLRIFDDRYLKTLSMVKVYLFTFGTWQYWDMFAPNPADTDVYGDSVVHYKNGATRIYQYPRMFLMSIPEKFVGERFRKFYERVHDLDHQYMYEPFLYREALDCYSDPKNPPIRLDLRIHAKAIVEPGRPEPKDYSTSVYFIGEIDPAVLNRMAEEEKHPWRF